MKSLGIMNGTSLDGVDFVLINVNSKNLECHLLAMKSFKFSSNLKMRLSMATQHLLLVDELALLHHELGRYYAQCFNKLPAVFKEIDCIGLHGQTVFHAGGVATLQIGEPSYLSATALVPVVSDFRVADIALGGQGAPLATFFHQIVFGKKNKTVSVHNLGGISNLTLIENGQVTRGFDTGPANMLLDMVIQKSTKGKKLFDRNGALAKQGKINTKLVQQMLLHPFLKKNPPKSCGREEFGEIFLKKYNSTLSKLPLADQLATLTEFVATSIIQSYKKFGSKNLSEIIFCGGGARNAYLLQKIQIALEDVTVTTSDELGWPAQSIEGAAFALLAAARLEGFASNLPKTTGAKRFSSLGKITSV